MAASFQEEFLGELSKTSLGSYSLFEPDAYQKGAATREPADLAWFSRDCVLLLNMQRSNASQSVHDAHNFAQLKGWMRAWAAGRALEGRNSSRNFSINFDDVLQVLAISVTSDPNAEVLVLSQGAASASGRINSRLSACVSVPESILIELARLGGAAIDLVDLILRVASEGGRLNARTAATYLRDQRDWSMKRALADRRVRPDRDEDLDTWVHQSIGVGLRAAGLSGQATHSDGFHAFNDLDWESTASLVLSSADVFRLVRDVPFGEFGPSVAALSLHLNPYRFFVAAYDINKQSEFIDQLIAAEKKLQDEHPDEPVVGLHWHIVGRPKVEFASAMITIADRQHGTATAAALNELNQLVTDNIR